MRREKKAIALVLALILVLTLTVSAFAADAPTKGTITIKRAVEDNGNGNQWTVGDFNLYRIFDAVLAFDEEGNPTGAISYTCTDEQKAIDGFDTYFVADAANNVLGVTVAGGKNGELSPEAVQWIKNNIEALGTLIPEVSVYEWRRAPYNSSSDVVYYTEEYIEEYWRMYHIYHNVPFGYYFVDSTVGSAVMVNTTQPDVTIEDKNETPTLDKQITKFTNQNNESQTVADHSPWISTDGSGALAQIGDTVSYDITVHIVPHAVQYILSDSMTRGLSLKAGSVTVKLNGEALDESYYTLLTDPEGKLCYDRNANAIIRYDRDTDTVLGTVYTLPESSNGDYIDVASQGAYSYYDEKYTNCDSSIVVIFSQEYLDTIAEDTDVVVSYDAVITQHAIDGNQPSYNSNEATLSYGHAYSISDYANVNTLQLVVYKYEGSDASSSSASRPLNGVGFVLSREDGKYFKQDPDTLAITWVDDINQATKLVTGTQMIWGYSYEGSYYGYYTKTPHDGYIIVDGLGAGQYTLIETDPLPGFNRAPDVHFTLPSGNYSPNWWRTQLNVANKTGTLLPSTGGMGVTVFYVCGLTALLGAAVLLLSKKRKSDTV